MSFIGSIIVTGGLLRFVSKGFGIGQHREQRQRDIRLLSLQFSELGVSQGEVSGAISQSAVSLIVAQYRAIHS